MTTIVVTPFTDNTKTLVEALEGFNSVYRDYGSRVFIVNHGGAAKELAKKVGFSKKRGANTGIIMEVADYYGYANTDLWRWMDQS